MRPSLLARMDAWAVRSPNDVAATQGDVEWSIAELRDRSRALASALHSAGVMPGDNVAWWGSSSLDFATVLLATWRLDATYVGIHPRYTPREVLGVMERVNPRVVLHEVGAAAWRDSAVLTEAVEQGRVRRIESMSAASDAVVRHTPSSVHPAVIVFTTGSTGAPKAALISHRAIAAASEHQTLATDVGVTCTINALPANHIGGLVNITTSAWWAHTCVAFVPAFSPAAVVDVLNRREGIRLGAVPMLFRRCLDDPSFAAAATGSLRHALSGGAALPRSVYDALTALGIRVQGMYGQTEMSGSVCFTSHDDDAATTCETIGRPHSGIEARLAAADGGPTDGDEGAAGARATGIRRLSRE
jgi:acyl-CoA synthetase (AMP-forming)/AMP-acid ligase II